MRLPNSLLVKLTLGGALVAAGVAGAQSLEVKKEEERKEKEQLKKKKAAQPGETGKTDPEVQPDQEDPIHEPAYTQEPEHKIKWPKRITADYCPPCGMG